MTMTHAGRIASAARFGPGFDRTFRNDRVTLGLFFPIEAFVGPRPSMEQQIDLAQEETCHTAIYRTCSAINSREIQARNRNVGTNRTG